MSTVNIAQTATTTMQTTSEASKAQAATATGKVKVWSVGVPSDEPFTFTIEQAKPLLDALRGRTIEAALKGGVE